MHVTIFKIIKIFTACLLVLCFVINSWHICQYFIDGKRVTSRNMKVNMKVPQKMPAIIICRKKAYNDPRKDMSHLEDYLENTMKLNYSVYGENYKNIELNSAELKQEYVYSFTRGLCIVLKYVPEV